MTAPFSYPDYSQQFGVSSPVAQQEWDTMLQRRQQLVDEISQRLKLTQQLPNPVAAENTYIQHQLTGTNADGSPTTYQAANTPPNDHELNQLLGAAQFYGIGNADKIPPIQLKQIVEQRRLSMQNDNQDRSVGDKIQEGATEFLGALGLGGLNEMVGLAQRLPFIGDAFAKTQAAANAEQWIAKMNENVTAGLPSADVSGYRTASKLGGMLAYALPATAAWKLVGATGILPTVTGEMTPIARMGVNAARGLIQGGASTALLEGGGDAPWQERAQRIAIGAGIAGGAEGILAGAPLAWEKIRSFFNAKTDPFYENPAPPVSPGTVDADWWFEADHQLPSGQAPAFPGMEPAPLVPPGSPQAPAPELPDPNSIRIDRNQLEQYGQSQQQPAGLLMSPERAQMEARLHNIVEQRDVARRALETDNLTGAGNRTALMRVRDQIDADPELGWVLFDGKQFKAVNDTFGHDAGDQALANFGRAIQQTAAEMQIPARFFRQGGDEFSAIVPNDVREQFAQRATQLSQQQLTKQNPIDAQGNPLGSPLTVNTQLDAYHSNTFAEADLGLVANKRGVSAPANAYDFTGAYAGIAPTQLSNELVTGIGDLSRGAAEGNPNFIPSLQARYAELSSRGLSDQQIVEQFAAQQEGLGYPRDLALASFDRFKGVLDTQSAASEGATLSKQAALISSDLPAVAASSQLGDADVVENLAVTRPGRVHVIQDVGDLGQTIRQLTQSQVAGRLMPHQFRLVEREGRLDLLVGDGESVTNKRVNQYRDTGMFEGQRATVNGRLQTIISPAGEDGMVAVADPISGEQSLVHSSAVLPSASSDAAHGVAGEQLYNQFKNHVQQAMDSQASALGGAVDTSWLSHETSTQLPHLLDSFLDAHADSPRARAAFEAYFNARRVQDFRAAAPEEAAEADRASSILAEEVLKHPPVIPNMEEIAASKGFSFVNDQGAESGTLIDRLSDLKIPVESPEAAVAFLRGFNRDVPDYTPFSDVPPELTNAGPHAANPGDDLEPVMHDGAESHERSLRSSIDRMAEQLVSLGEEPELERGGGSGAGAPPPPPPESPALAGGAQPILPPGERSLGAQVAELARRKPAALDELLRKSDSLWLQFMKPFRSVTLDVQKDLEDLGVSEGKLWDQSDAVRVGVTEAHNAAVPWHKEAATIFSGFRRQFLRDGTVTRIQEIADPNQKIDAMNRAGYTPDERRAQNHLADFNDRFFSYLAGDPAYTVNHSRYVFGYMSHVRQMQGMPGIRDPFADTNGFLSHHFTFFAEMAREGNMQFRQMDARVLTAKMVRAAMFKKYVSEPFEQMANAWDDPRIPAGLRNLATDWLKVVKTGHNPDADVAIKGARYFLNKMGVPVTDGEAASMWNSIFTAQYRGALGGRPDAVFRDSIQPWLAGTQIGFKPVADAYRRFLSGEAGEMMQRGLDKGWIEKGQVRVANADVFEHNITDSYGQPLLDPKDIARRNVLARVGDLAWNMTPARLRAGIQGTGFDPLFFYQRLGELNRLISGDAGWKKASDAIANYTFEVGKVARGESKLGANKMLVDRIDRLRAKLMKESAARTYPRPIQQRFGQLIDAEDYEGAADLMGREAANSQFLYGARENPIGIRKLGTFGRMAMMFGSFTQQYLAKISEQLLNPDVPIADRVATGLRHSVVTSLLGAASAYTGWNFSKWMWHQSLAFAGGPEATGLYNAFQAGSGLLAQASGQSLTPGQTQALDSYAGSTAGSVVGGLLGAIDPTASTRRTAENLYGAMNGLNPVERSVRTLVTGESDLRPDLRQFVQGQTTYSRELLDAASAGDPAALQQLTPEEQSFVGRLKNVPPAQRFQAFMSYHNAAANRFNDSVTYHGVGSGAMQ